MSDEYAVSLRQWTDVLRRTRLGRTAKAVGLMLATYADSDGTRVYPGIARLAVECELTYNVVQTALAKLRDGGLIELVRKATRRGDSDEYRLIIAIDLIERVDVLSPSQVTVAIEQMRSQRRGKVRSQPSPNEPPPHPTKWGAGEGELHPTARGEQTEAAPHGVCTKTDLHPTASCNCTPRRYPPPSMTVSQELTAHSDDDLRATVTVPRARASPPKINSSSSKCSHGLSAGRRDDGTATCAICRRDEARAA